MKEYQIFTFINNPIVVILRASIFIAFIILIILLKNIPQALDIALYIYTLFIMSEIYIHFHINNKKPEKTVWETDNPDQALDWKVKDSLNSLGVRGYIHGIRNKYPQKFFQEKIGAPLESIEDIDKKILLEKALILTKSANGTYITEMCIFASYILLREEHTKYLESQNLNLDDIPYILFWTHKRFPPRIERKDDMPLVGGGAFDFFVYGWNAELKKYAYDFTQQSVRWGASAHAVGRPSEYDLFVKALLKGKNNNVLLVGEPGVGKTSLVAFFAKEAYNARLPGHLKHTRVFAFALDHLLAGANTEGELETRITTLLAEVAHSGDVIIYMPNIELLFGSQDHRDLSGSLYDTLKSSQIQIIGTTTPDEYEQTIKRRSTTASLFETILMKEPDTREARFMIFESITHLEKSYHVSFSYGAIVAAIDYADDYQTNLFLPGSAMVLLEDSAADSATKGNRNIHDKEVLEVVQKKTNILLKNPTEDEKQNLLHLEDELKKTVVGQDTALVAVANAMRRLRSGFKDENKPIASFLFLGPTGVGKTQTAKSLAHTYFGGEENMTRLDMSEYNTPEAAKKLLGEMPGEDYIESLIAKVQQKPFSLILLDEFEKADPHVLDMFLQVLDDARLTNNKGETASFENTIIIVTSNAGSEFIRENISSPDINKKLQEHLLQKGIFKPELLNRFSEVVTFTPLGKEQIAQIVMHELVRTSEDIKEEGVQIAFDLPVVQKIVQEGFDPQFGARNTRRYIEKNIEGLIAKSVLDNTLKKGQQGIMTVDSTGNFVIK